MTHHIETTVDPITGIIVKVERIRLAKCAAPECVAEQARFRRIWPDIDPCYGGCEWSPGLIADTEVGA